MNTYFIPVKRKNRKNYKIEKFEETSISDIYKQLNDDNSVEEYSEAVKKYKIVYRASNKKPKSAIIYANNKKEAAELSKYKIESIKED